VTCLVPKAFGGILRHFASNMWHTWVDVDSYCVQCLDLVFEEEIMFDVLLALHTRLLVHSLGHEAAVAHRGLSQITAASSHAFRVPLPVETLPRDLQAGPSLHCLCTIPSRSMLAMSAPFSAFHNDMRTE